MCGLQVGILDKKAPDLSGAATDWNSNGLNENVIGNVGFEEDVEGRIYLIEAIRATFIFWQIQYRSC